MIAEEIVARLRVEDAGQFASGLAGARGALSRFESGARATGKSMQASGRSMMTGMTVPLVAMGVAGLKTAADFERSMNTFQVAAGHLPDSELEAFSDLAMEMGAKTEFSATDAASAMLELAKGGMDPAIIKAGALQATMALASAGGLELADAATTTSNAMNMFGLKGEQAGQVADALAGAANASSADVSDLTQSLAQVGTSAAASGLTIQETTAVLARFADAGIKGSDAGTSLKTFLSRLNPVTAKASAEMNRLGMSFYDSTGKMKNLAGIQSTLRAGLAGMSQKERQHAIQVMFGSDAQRAANILFRQGKKDLADYTAETSRAGNAQEMSNARMKGLAGAMERMSGSLETAGKAMGDALAPAIEAAAGGIEGLANKFTALPAPVQTAAASFGVLLAAAGPVTWILGKMASAAGIAAGAFRGLVSASMGLSGLGGILGTMGSVAGILLTVVPAALAFNGAIMGITGKLGAISGLQREFFALGQTIVGLAPVVGPALAAINNISGSLGGLSGIMNMITGSTNSTKTAMFGLGAATGAASNQFRQFTALTQAANGAQLNAQIQGMRQQLTGLGGSWGQVKAQVLQAAAAQQQQRNMAVQAANGNQQAVQRANAAYQSSIVKLASVVPASQRAGGAFRSLAKSAGMSASGLRSAVAKYRQGGQNAGKALGQGIRQGAQNAGQAGKQAASRAAAQTAQGMRTGGNKIKQAARSAGKGASTGLAQGVRQGAGQAKSAGSKVTAQVSQGFRTGGNKLKSAGQQAGKQGATGLGNGIKQGSGQALAAETQLTSSLATAMVGAGGTLMSAGYSAGQMMGAGLVNGILSMLGAAQEAAAQLAEVAAEAARSKAEIASPSKVWTRMGRHMVQGLVKGLGAGKKDVKDAAEDLADATARAFNDKVTDFKQAAKKIVDYIVQIRQQIQTFAGVQGFDVSGAQQAAMEHAAAQEAATAATQAQAEALAKKQAAERAVASAAAAVARWDAAGNHYRTATALEQQAKATEGLTAATEAYQEAVKAAADAAAGLAAAPAGGVTPTAVIGDMTVRAKAATDFAENIKKLKAKGLDDKAIQQLIEAGVDSGGAVAKALLNGNVQANIRAVNEQTNAMEKASRALADMAGQAKFGPQATYDRQNAIVETKIEVKNGAIKINFGDGINQADKRELQKIAQEALDKAMRQLAREIKQKKKRK